MEIAILGVLICQLLLLLISLAVAARLILSLSKSAHSFLESPGEGKQSPLADILGIVSDRLGAAIIAHAKAWLLSQNSIAVRQDKAAARQELQASAPPWLGMAMKFSPGIGKIVNKNPELAQLAMAAFQNMGNKGASEEEKNNGSSHSQDPFKL